MSDVGQGGPAVPPGSRPAVLPDDAEALSLARYHLLRAIKHAVVLHRVGELASAQGDLELLQLVADWALIEARTTLDIVQRSQTPGGTT